MTSSFKYSQLEYFSVPRRVMVFERGSEKGINEIINKNIIIPRSK